MVSIQVFATPMIGRAKSSSVNPIPLSIARAPARSRPFVIIELCRLGSSVIIFSSYYRFLSTKYLVTLAVTIRLLTLSASCSKVRHYRGSSVKFNYTLEEKITTVPQFAIILVEDAGIAEVRYVDACQSKEAEQKNSLRGPKPTTSLWHRITLEARSRQQLRYTSRHPHLTSKFRST